MMTRSNARLRSTGPIVEVLAAVIGSVIIAFPTLWPLIRNLTAPWGSGDLIAHYIDANVWAPFGLPITTHFGFPDGLDHRYVPTLDITQNGFAWVIGTITDSPFLGLNLLYLLSFPITAALTVIALRLVGVRGPIAIALAIAFTCIPYHFDRGLSHLYLATMYAAVTGVILAIIIGTNRTPRRSDGALRTLAIAALVIITAWSGVYPAVFAIILTTAAVIWRWIHRDAPKRLLGHALIPIGIAVLTVLGLTPALIARTLTPPLADLLARVPTDSVQLAGNIAQLLIPYSTQWQASDIVATTAGENRISGYGTLITTAALLTFLIGWAWLHRRNVPTTPLPFVGYLTVITAWFFTPSGGGFLFASVITPQIRAWGRLTPILLLLFILGAGAVLAHTRITKPAAWRSPLALAIAVLILATTLITNVWPFRATFNKAAQKGAVFQSELDPYIAQVNAAIPERCGILQLPYLAYPENGVKEPRLNDYEHAWHPLVNPDKDYSYGAVKGTQASVFAASLGDEASFNQLAQLPGLGFCAIHVDKRGYRNPAWQRINNTLRAEYGQPVARGLDGKWLTYRISEPNITPDTTTP